MQQQNYDSFLVLDFEATCEPGSNKTSNQEIIEFPVLKVDGRTFDVTDKFHEYVKPVKNPQLSDFCIKLTGITQSIVDESDDFSVVFSRFQDWVERTTGDQKFILVTCGDWDLKLMLPEQCKRSSVPLPSYCTSWINIKKSYATSTGVFAKGMMPMMKGLKLAHVGRLHSGIDDATNIANIVKALAYSGLVFSPTSLSKGHCQDNINNNVVCKTDHSHASTTKPAKKTKSKSKAKPQSLPEAIECIPSKPKTLEVPNINDVLKVLKCNTERFQERDRDDVATLCAVVKYFNIMDRQDCILVENRLRFYYNLLPQDPILLQDNFPAIAYSDISDKTPNLATSYSDAKANVIRAPPENEWINKKSKKSKKKAKKAAIHEGFVFV